MRFTNKFPYTNINNINLDWIIKRVKELGETVLSYAQDIANAVALAEAAQEAADSVTGTAESAVTTAQAAEATANAIAGTANTALTTAQAAEATAQAAEATANAIAGTANNALTTAQAANATAQAANATAQAAEESADNAETIAGTASANASNAVQMANTALATAQTALSIASQFDMSVLNEKAGALITEDSGAVVSFVPDRTIVQDLSVSVAVEPVQDLHGYDNPWPAGGNYNLVPPTSAGDETINGIRIQTDGNGTIHITGTASANAQKTFNITEITLPSADIYVHLLNNAVNANVSFFFWYNGQSVGGITLAALNRIYKLPALTGATINQVTLVITNGQTVDIIFSPMLCLDGVVKTFAPYSNICPISSREVVEIMRSNTDVSNPNIYTIQIGQSVFGGPLDATNGVMTADMTLLDLGDKTWTSVTVAGYTRFKTSITDIARVPSSGVVASMVCSNYPTKTANETYRGAMGISLQGNSADIYIYDPQKETLTAEEFKTAMSGVQLCYKNTTPLEIQLDPVQIAAIAGEINNVWSDAGNVTVEFAADLKWYIDSKIAEVQALALENGG